MAEKDSRADKYVIWQCVECGHNHYFRKEDCKQYGLNCEDCRGKVAIAGYTNQRPKPLRNAKNVGTLTVDIDCSKALTGLKAIQREARKATQALKELEEQQKRSKKKVLHVQFHGMLSSEEMKKLKESVRRSLTNDGFLVSDNLVQVGVLEVDEIVIPYDEDLPTKPEISG